MFYHNLSRVKADKTKALPQYNPLVRLKIQGRENGLKRIFQPELQRVVQYTQSESSRVTLLSTRLPEASVTLVTGS